MGEHTDELLAELATCGIGRHAPKPDRPDGAQDRAGGPTLEQVFGLKVAFRDPAVGVFGLTNVVMPVGGEFLEVLEPMRDDASGARYLARRGGDAGYMVILQDDDALAHRARLEAEGVRVIAKSDGRYRFSHFHPADCAGVLLSIDSVEGGGDWREERSDWPPAGPDWRGFASETSLGLAGVTIQARDPLAAAERWSMLLDRRARPGRRASWRSRSTAA